MASAARTGSTCAKHGGNVNLALLLHHLDLLRIPADLTPDLQLALGTDRGGAAPLAHPAPSRPRITGGGRGVPDHAGPRTGAGAAATGVLLQTPHPRPVSRRQPQPVSLSIVTGYQQAPEDLIC